MLESLFNKISGLWACEVIEKRLQRSCFLCILRIFIYFEKHLQAAASDYFFTLVIYLFSYVFYNYK